MHSTESSENYLETILILSKKLPVVRSVDIANELGFKKSSVSIAMKNLREKNQITVTDAGFIYLSSYRRCMPYRACDQRRKLCCHQKTSSSVKRRRIICPAGDLVNT